MAAITLPESMKASLRETFSQAISDVMSDAGLWDEVDRWLQDDLEKDSNCWLRFNGGKPECLIGLGSGDATIELLPEITIDAYSGFDLSEPARHSQLADVREQLAGIDAMIAELQRHRETLLRSIPPDQNSGSGT